jgi:hypothetical protein
MPRSRRWWRRKATAVASLILLCASFAAIIALNSLKGQVGTNVPKLSDCAREAPAAYLGSYDTVDSLLRNTTAAAGAGTTTTAATLSIVRPPLFDRLDVDAACVAATSDTTSVYAVYSTNSSTSSTAWRDPYVAYSMSACSSSAARHQCPVLPVAGESLPLRCPCISPSSPEACPVLQCALKGLQGNDCDSFVFSTLAGCYCVDRLKGAQATSGNLLSNVHDVQVSEATYYIASSI